MAVPLGCCRYTLGLVAVYEASGRKKGIGNCPCPATHTCYPAEMQRRDLLGWGFSASVALMSSEEVRLLICVVFYIFLLLRRVSEVILSCSVLEVILQHVSGSVRIYL